LLDIAKRVDACREEANIGKTRLAVHRNL